MDSEVRQLVQDLARQGLSIRAIARKLGLDRKTVRRLAPPAAPAPARPRKLEGFEAAIRQRIESGLAGPRILRELRQMGYRGSRTLLMNRVRELRGPSKPKLKVFRRFETEPAEEAQVDWSLYRVPLAGVPTAVHAFGMVLAFSRMLFVAFYRNEQLPTLLHAHVEAFEFFGGICRRIVYDNMTTVTLGRIGGEPRWNQAFLEFARHHGFTPKVCRVRDPNRKGRIERVFSYLEGDFLRGRSFASWEDLNLQAREWLASVANRRMHSTVREIPEERFARERDLLIRLPAMRFPTERRLVRKVEKDGYVQVDGSFYPVPDAAPGKLATVRVYPNRVEILDAVGAVAAVYPVPDRPTRILPRGGRIPRPSEAVPRSKLEARFLAQFPAAGEFLAGLARRMKTLAPIHLQRLEHLVGLYGEEAVRAALARAREYRNFSAYAVERVLEKAHPDVLPPPPPAGPWVPPETLGASEDVDGGDPRHYRFDSMDPSAGGGHGT